MIIHTMDMKLNGAAPLAHFGVIRVQGAEATGFLQSQLTQDFASLGPSQGRLAAFCNAKGRMLASFYAFRSDQDEILLVCNKDLLVDTVKRMSMFVLRTKVRLTDASDDFALYGLAGEAIESTAGTLGPSWSRLEIDGASVFTLPAADGVQRALWVAHVAETRPNVVVLSQPAWAWGEVRSGVAMISTPIVGAFVPQMLNYESVGGVSFKKGCYPGQEVVARSQFRGSLKRRGYLAHSQEPMQAGEEVFQLEDQAQPCGTVAQAAESPLGGFDAIVSMQVAAADSRSLHVRGVDGPALTVTPPPYPLLSDI